MGWNGTGTVIELRRNLEQASRNGNCDWGECTGLMEESGKKKLYLKKPARDGEKDH